MSGTVVEKIPNGRGAAKQVRIYLHKSDSGTAFFLRWDSKKKSENDASLALEYCSLHIGVDAGAFLNKNYRNTYWDQRHLCFTVMGVERSLDVCCSSLRDYHLWIRVLARYVSKN